MLQAAPQDDKYRHPLHSRLWRKMAKLSWFSKFYWKHLAGPKSDRNLHRLLLDHSFNSVLEIGIGNGSRTERVFKLLTPRNPEAMMRYTVIDAFESAAGHLTLKQAHKMLAEKGVKSTLVPGDLTAALVRVGNSVGQHELIIADGILDPAAPSASLLAPWLKKVAQAEAWILCSGREGETLSALKISDLQLRLAKQAA